MMDQTGSDSHLLDQDARDLGKEAILLTNRTHLEQRCELLQVDQDDLFAKARVYSDTLSRLRAKGMFQYGIPIESRPGPTVTMTIAGESRSMVMLASNDYLNLSTEPRVHAAIVGALAEYGVSAGSSRAATGYSSLHESLEADLARRYRKEAAILFPTGFDAIAGPMIALCTKRDRVLIDGSSHASILDGAHASGATVRVFPHNSVEALRETLDRTRKRVDKGGLLVVVEGAYSMDGDIARLPEIAGLCREFSARLMVDEAHAIGVYGSRGLGVTEHFALEQEVDIVAGTFSKSLGSIGGFIAADREVVTYLNYMTRKLVFSASIPPMLVAGIKAAFEIMEEAPSLRERLWENVRYLADGLEREGATLLGRETASVPVLVADDGIIFSFARDLIERGVFAYPIVFPLVPKNRSIFRLAVQARHEPSQLDRVIEVFGELMRKYRLSRSAP
jgi:8-amino-7-oxononanoate synthase